MACASCLRRLRLSTKLPWPRPILLQIRGKKTRSAREPNFVNVRLRGDIAKYGRKGAIVPIAPGRMRNDWFPRGKAEYVNDATLRQMKSQNIVFQRDFGFKIGQEDVRKTDAGEVTADIPHESLKVDVELLTPTRSRQLISMLIPPSIEFYRQPILATKEPTPNQEQKGSAGEAEPETPHVSEQAAISDSIGIYGSVTTTDITVNMKAVLAENDEGSRVVILPEDITFVQTHATGTEEQADRVKTLGEFEIEIKVKGSDEAVRKKIRVRAQE